MSSKQTKSVNLSTEFLRAAAADAEGSLAYMLLAAFGVSLLKCMQAVEKMVTTKDTKMILFCLASAVQIRGNVVYIGPQFANVRVEYPDLIIEGAREQKDVFNFGACHICGHLLANMSSEPLAVQILKKAGDCVTGANFTDNEAGKINQQIFSSHSREDRDAYQKWENEYFDSFSGILDPIIASLPTLSKSFAETMKAPLKVTAGPPVIAARPPASAGKKDGGE